MSRLYCETEEAAGVAIMGGASSKERTNIQQTNIDDIVTPKLSTGVIRRYSLYVRTQFAFESCADSPIR
jgi:hypothetical protein